MHRRAEWNAEYSARPDVKASRAEWNAANSERIRKRAAERYAENRDAEIAYRAKYRADNPHVMWEGGYRSRARSFGFEPVVVSFTREQLVERYGDACVDCGGDWAEVDHVIPVIAGGAHVLENCQPVCHRDNVLRWYAYKRELERIAR